MALKALKSLDWMSSGMVAFIWQHSSTEDDYSDESSLSLESDSLIQDRLLSEPLSSVFYIS